MKNKKHLIHRLVDLAQRELEMTLAVVMILAFAFGYSYASTDLETGDISIQEETSVGNFGIDGRQYNAVTFSTSPGLSEYRVRTGVDRGDYKQTADGLTGIADGATYTYTVNLSPTFSGNAYVHGDYDRVTLNGNVLKSATNAAPLANTSRLKLTFTGGDLIKGIYLYAGSTDDTTVVTRQVGTLYILPTTTEVMVGQNRSFKLIALDTNGNSMDTNASWQIVAGSEYAEINTGTGELTATKAGGPVTVKASINGVSAQATVTIKESEIPSFLSLVTEKKAEDANGETGTEDPDWYQYIPPKDSAEPEDDSALDEVADSLTPSEEQSTETKEISKASEDVLDLFADTKTSARKTETDSTRPTQKEINAVVAEQTTFTAKVTARATAAFQEIKTTVQEIFVGRTIENPETGEQTQVKSVFQEIGGFLSRLFLGVSQTEGEGGAGAATPLALPGAEPGDEN